MDTHSAVVFLPNDMARTGLPRPTMLLPVLGSTLCISLIYFFEVPLTIGRRLKVMTAIHGGAVVVAAAVSLLAIPAQGLQGVLLALYASAGCDVLAMAGCGVAGLVVGGALASWGVTQESIASGRIELRTTPTKMIVTDRARCSGCQRCEMMCTLKNDGRVCQHIARVRVWDNYYWGKSADTGDGSFGDGKGACEFTVEHCKQCADPQCVKYCPVHAIYADEKTGARTVDTKKCIGCGMCSQACPWNMPRVDTETGVSTKCISCGRCAEQCPNGAIQFIDWQDIAQKIIDEGIVRTTTAVTA